MTIFVNEKEIEIENDITAAALLEQLRLKPSRSAVWVNGKKLLMAEYGTTVLRPGDKVKAVRLFGGG